MKTADIPVRIFAEACEAIAGRRGNAEFDRATIPEEELMAALAYLQGFPLIEIPDINETLLAHCRALARDLDPAALEDYGFVPLAVRGRNLVAISRCPWDPITVEIISSYFPQCPRIRFALTSPENLAAIISRLAGTAVAGTATAGRAPDSVPPSSQQTQPAKFPTTAAASPDHRDPAVTPDPAPGPAQSPPNPAAAGQLTTEEVTHVFNVLAQEITRVRQRGGRKQL